MSQTKTPPDQIAPDLELRLSANVEGSSTATPAWEDPTELGGKLAQKINACIASSQGDDEDLRAYLAQIPTQDLKSLPEAEREALFHIPLRANDAQLALTLAVKLGISVTQERWLNTLETALATPVGVEFVETVHGTEDQFPTYQQIEQEQANMLMALADLCKSTVILDESIKTRFAHDYLPALTKKGKYAIATSLSATEYLNISSGKTKNSLEWVLADTLREEPINTFIYAFRQYDEDEAKKAGELLVTAARTPSAINEHFLEKVAYLWEKTNDSSAPPISEIGLIERLLNHAVTLYASDRSCSNLAYDMYLGLIKNLANRAKGIEGVNQLISYAEARSSDQQLAEVPTVESAVDTHRLAALYAQAKRFFDSSESGVRVQRRNTREFEEVEGLGEESSASLEKLFTDYTD